MNDKKIEKLAKIAADIVLLIISVTVSLITTYIILKILGK